MDRVFVANMTGNVVFVGFGVAGARGFSVAASATALGGFAVGAVAGGRLPRWWRADRARLLWTTNLAELVLAAPVLVVAATSGIRSGRADAYALLALLSASMGVQNATVRQLAVPDFATNVITTALTGLFTDLPALGWRHPAIGYRLASVVSLFAGATVGAVLVLRVGPAPHSGSAGALAGWGRPAGGRGGATPVGPLREPLTAAPAYRRTIDRRRRRRPRRWSPRGSGPRAGPGPGGSSTSRWITRRSGRAP